MIAYHYGGTGYEQFQTARWDPNAGKGGCSSIQGIRRIRCELASLPFDWNARGLSEFHRNLAFGGAAIALVTLSRALAIYPCCLFFSRSLP